MRRVGVASLSARGGLAGGEGSRDSGKVGPGNPSRVLFRKAKCAGGRVDEERRTAHTSMPWILGPEVAPPKAPPVSEAVRQAYFGQSEARPVAVAPSAPASVPCPVCGIRLEIDAFVPCTVCGSRFVLPSTSSPIPFHHCVQPPPVPDLEPGRV